MPVFKYLLQQENNSEKIPIRRRRLKWADIQSMERIILQLRQQGRTRQEIANELNLDKEQIKNWIKRYNRKQAQPSVPLKRKGRPRKRPITESQAMALRIRELEREVELYRSFLQAAGRM